jgi:uncharacterized protein (DUF488 family)
MSQAGPASLLTFGHGTAEQVQIVEVLRGAGVEQLVDVRRFPGSRRNPHVARDLMQQWLPDAGIAYRWEPRLGGRRAADDEPSPDTWWQVAAFRAYAGYTRTAEFGAGLADLLADAGRVRVAVMCSETVWWRCHRRLISDVAVLLHRVDVQHLGHDGRLTPHPPAAGARVTAAGLVYDRGSDE